MRIILKMIYCVAEVDRFNTDDVKREYPVSMLQVHSCYSATVAKQGSCRLGASSVPGDVFKLYHMLVQHVILPVANKRLPASMSLTASTYAPNRNTNSHCGHCSFFKKRL